MNLWVHPGHFDLWHFRFNFNENRRKQLLKRLNKRKPWQPIIISDNLTWSEFSKLNIFLHELQGIKPVVSIARKYLADGSSSHLIGYVADISVKDLENSELLRKNDEKSPGRFYYSGISTKWGVLFSTFLGIFQHIWSISERFKAYFQCLNADI